MIQDDLFGAGPELPHGLLYRQDFITREEEASLIAEIAQLGFRQARFRQYTAKRRVVRFGADHVPVTQEKFVDEEAEFPRIEFPPFLCNLRSKIAAWTGIPEERFEHGLVTEYSPGTPIGWHRDAPHFEIVAGISLNSACRMRFRAFADRYTVFGLDLKPRSVYVMRDDIRWKWEHSIPPVKATPLLLLPSQEY